MTYPESGHPGQPDHAGQPGPSPAFEQPPPPSRPKRTAVVVLAIIAVLALGAAATFGALWYLEREDHAQASEQLTDEKKAHEDTKSQLGEAEEAKKAAESEAAALAPCADAGKEIARLALADASEEEATRAGAQLVIACGR